jgi:hypothetical protein
MKQWVLVLLTLVVSACSSIKVQVDTSLGIDANRYQTYSWSSDVAVDASGGFARLAAVDEAMRSVVSEKMTAKGYRHVERESAHLLLDYRVMQQLKVDQGGLISPTDESRRAWDINSDPANTAIYNHQVPTELKSGVVILMASDAKTDQVLWQGQAVKLLENDYPNSEQTKALVTELVNKLLKEFPAR